MFFNQVLSFFRRRTETKKQAAALYQACVAQSRSSALYRRFGLLDDVQTRFEFLTAHLWLVMYSLRNLGEPTLARLLAETFFSDMDATLREAGEGDLGVPKRIKVFAQAFYGRLAAYDKAREQGDFSTALANHLPATDDLFAYFTDAQRRFATTTVADYFEPSQLFDSKSS